MDRKKIRSALGRIRWLQTQDRYSIPEACQDFFLQLAKHKLDRRIFSRNQMRELLSVIEDKMNVILQDATFASQRFWLEQAGIRFTPEHALELAHWLLEDKVVSEFPDIPWEELTFEDLCLECRTAAPFRTEYLGEVFEGVVSGITRLVCTVRFRNYWQRVFCKFVSHPFYQYGQMPGEETKV